MTNVVPTGWLMAALGDVVEVRDFEREPINSTERSQRIVNKTKADLFPYYGATGQVGWIDDFRSEGEQVLLGEDGAPFLDPNRDKAYVVSGRYWVNNHAHVLRGVPGAMDNRFLNFQLNSVEYHQFVSGSTRLKLTSAAMKQIPLLVPPALEQTRIVEKLEELLSALDAGVAELKAAQRKLAQYRQSLLKAAVEGALTADWRNARHKSEKIPRPSSRRKPGSSALATSKSESLDLGFRRDDGNNETGADLLQRILTERRARWETKQLAKFAEQGKTPPIGWQSKYSEPIAPDTTDLPALPKEWVWASLDMLCEIQGGIQKQPSRTPVINKFPFLRVANVARGMLKLDDIHEIELFDGELERLALRKGDLLIVEGNGSLSEIGRCALWDGSIDNAVHQNHLIRARPVLAASEFVEAWLNSLLGIEKMTKLAATTSGLYTLSVGKISKIPVPLPPLAEQTEAISILAAALEGQVDQVTAITLGLKQSAAQSKNILKAAFAGQLVPQDPNDEPACILLERIRAERVSGGAKRSGKTGRKPREKA